MRMLLAVLMLWVADVAIAQPLSSPILLWPSGAPGATGTTDEDKPAIIPFIPDPGKGNGAAMLVVPGGGFTIRAVDHEGVLVAQWLRDHGIAAFLLRYRLRPIYDRKNWIQDGERAMQFIRMHASEYKISPERVGAVGFSAGANLIADMAFHPLSGNSNAPDPLDRFDALPNFLVLSYGSAPLPETVDTKIASNLPPIFMFGTTEDAGSVKGMMELYAGLVENNARVEAHFFQNGVHGTGFAIGDPVLGTWPQLMMNWIKIGGFLTDQKRIELNGVVKLDDKPLLRGMVVFSHVENPQAPPVVVYMTNTGTGELGRFVVPANQGPIPGKYKVVVRQEAMRWTSNSRDPFMIKMMAKQRDNTLTDADRKEWSDYLRKRDLSPSIDNQKVFTRQRPKDQGEYVVEIREGKEVVIEVYNY